MNVVVHNVEAAQQGLFGITAYRESFAAKHLSDDFKYLTVFMSTDEAYCILPDISQLLVL